MELPGADRAVIDPTKIRNYLLSPFHRVGRSKASFFRSLGYSQSQWEVLDADLLALARSGNATAGPNTPHGQKYEVRGNLLGPSGRQARVIAVWIVLAGETIPRFVTAYPEVNR